MQVIGADRLNYVFGKDNDVAARVAPGEVFEMVTHERFLDPSLWEPRADGLVPVNAVTGAVYVEGAEPGDVLQVDILDIIVTSEVGFINARPGRGGFAEDIPAERMRRVPIRGGFAFFDDDTKIPLGPHVGRLGVAPEGDEGIPTLAPGPYGGNMDNREQTKGTSILVPVWHPGALLSVGDLHGVQGDGESVLSAVEVAGRVVLRCFVRRDLALKRPMTLTDSEVMTLGDGETLDEAAKHALYDMAALLRERRGMDLTDAAMLISVAADLRVCQIVNPRKGMRCAISRRWLDL